jgi:membrane-associated phospholipid phosphatase
MMRICAVVAAAISCAALVVLGWHYATDVIGGALLGVVVVAGGIIVLTPRPWNRRSPVQGGGANGRVPHTGGRQQGSASRCVSHLASDM